VSKNLNANIKMKKITRRASKKANIASNNKQSNSKISKNYILKYQIISNINNKK